jgi:hypothetical protein
MYRCRWNGVLHVDPGRASAKCFWRQGCNIPDINIIVQWKLPAKLSSFIQRAGHAARGPNTVGLAVLLVEPTAYSI